MLLLVLISIACHFFLEAQSTKFDIDLSFKAKRNDSCIGGYTELKTILQGDKQIVDQLVKAFFANGLETDFVKITYEFEACDFTENSTCNIQENDNMNCCNQSELYIWSNSFLYLLGPEPLFYLTFTAINVRTSDVILQLPCLDTNEYSDLLLQLTFMVS